MRMRTAPAFAGAAATGGYVMYPIALSSRWRRLLHFDQTDDAPVASFLFVKVPKIQLSVRLKGTKRVGN
jgi:hypothetical protein